MVIASIAQHSQAYLLFRITYRVLLTTDNTEVVVTFGKVKYNKIRFTYFQLTCR